MTKKELSANRSKEKICSALLYCLSISPFKKITVKNIVEQAGVNRSTFYKYYLDKFDLLEFYLEQIITEFRSVTNCDFIKANKCEIDYPIYCDLFSDILDLFEKNCETYKILWNSEIGSDLYQNMIDILQSNILNTIHTDSLFTKDKLSYAILYSKLFSYNCMATVRWWMEHNDTIDFDTAKNIMKNNMEKGFFQTYRDIIEEGVISS